MEEKKVSILLAVFNGENYVAEAVESILSQTYKNLELIICDDGSTDNTHNILKNFEYDSRVLHTYQNHTGKVAAFNNAFSHATGDLFCLFAHDDLMLPTAIEARVKSIITHNCEAVFCNSCICDAQLNRLRPLYYNPRTLTWAEDHRNFFRQNMMGGGNTLIAKRIADKIYPIPDSLLFEDWWTGLHILWYAKVIHYINDTLILYRIHDTNSIGAHVDDNEFIKKRFSDWKRHPQFYQCLNKSINTWNLESDEYDEFKKIISNNQLLAERTVHRQLTFPTIEILNACGFKKYCMSQAMILHLAVQIQKLITFISVIKNIVNK